MGKLKCSLDGCHAPDALCKKTATPNYQQCEHFTNLDTSSKVKNNQNNSRTIPWTGQALQPNQIELLSHRSAPKIIGLIGPQEAGKTSYLAMLYTLLYNGKRIANWDFAGSYTLREWELQAKSLQVKDNGKVAYPDTTPSTPDFYSLYHLALRNDGHLHDILYADSSGEVFYKWSMNIDDAGAENARWIYEHSNGFLFFVDCEAVIKERGKAKKNIMQLAEQVKAGLNGRPINIIWSKADLIEEIRPNIKESIINGLSDLFPGATSLEVSNYSKTDSDQLCHINNLRATEIMLNNFIVPQRIRIIPVGNETTDYFFLYKGSYGTK